MRITRPEPGDSGVATPGITRKVELEGPGNVRDLGGLPISGRGTTRFGVVYRSDRLSSLTDSDVSRLQAAGIRYIFDLRSDGEAERSPNRSVPGATYVRLPMSTDRKDPYRTIRDRIVEGEIRRYRPADLVRGYVRMLERFGPSFAQIVKQVTLGHPIIVHCTAGKDRTGLAAMLLLDLAGVDPDHICADYALSAQRRTSRAHDQTAEGALRPMIRDLGLDPADFSALWTPRAEVMAATLEWLHETWTDAATYLTAAGVDAAQLAAARTRLAGT